MKPAAFTYLRPVSIDDALRQLAELGPQAKVIAGGQSLGPMMNMRLARPAQLIDLNDLTELAYVREAGDRIRVGALTRHYQIARVGTGAPSLPVIEPGRANHRPLRHPPARHHRRQPGPRRSGGAIALDCGDAGGPLQPDASRLAAPGRRRRFLCFGDDHLAGLDELIESIEFPKALAGEAASFRMFNRRHGDYAIVAVAATVTAPSGQGPVAAAGVGRCRAGAAAPGRAGGVLLRPHTRRRLDRPGGCRRARRGGGRGRQPRVGALSPGIDANAGRRCAGARIGLVAGIANPWKSRTSPSP